jgi:hypothetical protein
MSGINSLEEETGESLLSSFFLWHIKTPERGSSPEPCQAGTMI